MSTPGAESLPADVPEADWVDQVTEADPVTGEAGPPGSRSVTDATTTDEASEADLADQGTLAYGDADESRD